MVKRKVSDLIAEFLEFHNIDTIFGIIGSANSHIFDSISKHGYTKIICVHHEQAAILAMGAYFRSSGKLSAAIVTAGAGASNAITGVVSNWADSIPGLIISGQEQTKFINQDYNLRMFGIQGFDISKMVKNITKFSKTITNENDIQQTLETAYETTTQGRPGPVWIDVPFDIQSKQVDFDIWNESVQTQNISIYKPKINYLLDCIKKSKRPVIWAGHGIKLAGAKDEFLKIIENLKIPVILTWGAIDLLDHNHPYYYGQAGISGMRHSNFIIQNCDLLISIGTRMPMLQTGYDIKQFCPGAKKIVINNDLTEWSKFPADYLDSIICCDCKSIFNSILQTGTIYNSPSDWINYCNNLKDKYPLLQPYHVDGGSNYLNSYKFLNDLSNYLPNDEIIVTDMGTALLSGHYSLKLNTKQQMFTSLGLGEMGYGLPGAIGAAIANPTKKIICLNCDGGMMMNLQELQTIIHNNLNIKIIIFNNDGYLMIKHTQNMLFKNYHTCVDKNNGVSLPDYVKIGTAFGIPSEKLNSWDDFHTKITNLLNSNGPALLDVYMDPNQDFLPKVKGVVNEDNTISPPPLEEMSPLLPLEDIRTNMISGISPVSLKIKR